MKYLRGIIYSTKNLDSGTDLFAYGYCANVSFCSILDTVSFLLCQCFIVKNIKNSSQWCNKYFNFVVLKEFPSESWKICINILK